MTGDALIWITELKPGTNDELKENVLKRFNKNSSRDLIHSTA